MKYDKDSGTYSYEKGDTVAILAKVTDTRDAGNIILEIPGHPDEHLHISAAKLLGIVHEDDHDKDNPRPLDILADEKQRRARAKAGVLLMPVPADQPQVSAEPAPDLDPVAEPGAATSDPNLQPGPTEAAEKKEADDVPF